MQECLWLVKLDTNRGTNIVFLQTVNTYSFTKKYGGSKRVSQEPHNISASTRPMVDHHAGVYSHIDKSHNTRPTWVQIDIVPEGIPILAQSDVGC